MIQTTSLRSRRLLTKLLVARQMLTKKAQIIIRPKLTRRHGSAWLIAHPQTYQVINKIQQGPVKKKSALVRRAQTSLEPEEINQESD